MKKGKTIKDLEKDVDDIARDATMNTVDELKAAGYPDEFISLMVRFDELLNTRQFETAYNFLISATAAFAIRLDIDDNVAIFTDIANRAARNVKNITDNPELYEAAKLMSVVGGRS